ncbi:MAG: isochorismatase family protein, partial [Candidatus Hodarchaeales archaeon]
NRKIENLIIVGLQTEYCIDTTVRRAFSEEFNVTLVKDTHSTWNSSKLTAQQIIDHHNSILGDWFASLKAESQIKF